MSKPEKTSEAKSDWAKVGPCLYRYKGRTYYALVRHAGKQIRQSLETTDATLAKRRLAKFKSDLEKIDPEMARRDMIRQREIYEKTISIFPDTGKPRSASSLLIAKLAIKRLVEEWPQESPTEIRKIKSSDITLWLSQYTALSASSKNHMITEARRFFDQAVDQEVIAVSPMVKIKYAKPVKKKKGTPSEEEFLAIVANLRSQKANGHGSEDTADTVELSGRLGLGQAELAGICRKHIDIPNNTISVFRRKTSEAFSIPIFPQALTIILRRLEKMGSDPDARLLPHYNFKKGLAGACSRLGFQKFEPRSLRRFFITESLLKSIPATVVADWQGHQDGGALVHKTYKREIKYAEHQEMAKRLAPKPAGDNITPFKAEAAA
jgi:integrase